MARIDRPHAHRSHASSRSFGWFASLVAAIVAPAAAAIVVASGCSFTGGKDGSSPDFHDGDTNDEADAIVIEVGNDTAAPNPLCGPITGSSCIPDDFADAGPRTCTPVDAGADADASPPEVASSDAAIDTSGSGTRNACRVIRIGNTIATGCEPAGFGLSGSYCKRDADCSPGLACVGPSLVATCEPYCCTATADFDPCHASGRYCTPVVVTERPTDEVPVCILPDKCTLISNDGCTTDTTCTVVDPYGDTSCVPSGSLTDLQCCSTDPLAGAACSTGYACLGSLGDRVCRKICKIDGEACATGHCEAQSTFPTGYGVCTVDVSDSATDAGNCGT
jgi:hypothetical protein